MFLRVGRKIINTTSLADADEFEPGKSLHTHGEGLTAAPTVVVTTKAVEVAEVGTLGPRRIALEGAEADLFLEALPLYAPVLEGS